MQTVRMQSEARAKRYNATLIRINLRDTNAPEGAVSFLEISIFSILHSDKNQIVIPLGGKDALTRIEEEIDRVLCKA